jgi:membrane associated rhomboid family serine protease
MDGVFGSDTVKSPPVTSPPLVERRLGEKMAEERKGIDRFIEYDEQAAKLQHASRAIYKWVLDFLRNCMVVAALFYVAQKSGNWLVIGVAALAYFALAGYCYTYIEVWSPRYDVFGTTRLRLHIAVFLGVLVLHLILAGVTIGLYMTINKIVEAQVH